MEKNDILGIAQTYEQLESTRQNLERKLIPLQEATKAARHELITMMREQGVRKAGNCSLSAYNEVYLTFARIAEGLRILGDENKELGILQRLKDVRRGKRTRVCQSEVVGVLIEMLGHEEAQDTWLAVEEILRRDQDLKTRIIIH